jgi:hypothetical protein
MRSGALASGFKSIGIGKLLINAFVLLWWPLTFQHNGTTVTLQGVQATSPQTLQAITPSQVMRWHKGNDVWAMAVVEQPTDMTTPTPPAQVQALLSKYQHLFQEPKELPPHRSFDHTIPLLPNSPPVHSRPYRYSTLPCKKMR